MWLRAVSPFCPRCGTSSLLSDTRWRRAPIEVCGRHWPLSTRSDGNRDDPRIGMFQAVRNSGIHGTSSGYVAADQTLDIRAGFVFPKLGNFPEWESDGV